MGVNEALHITQANISRQALYKRVERARAKEREKVDNRMRENPMQAQKVSEDEVGTAMPHGESGNAAGGRGVHRRRESDQGAHCWQPVRATVAAQLRLVLLNGHHRP